MPLYLDSNGNPIQPGQYTPPSTPRRQPGLPAPSSTTTGTTRPANNPRPAGQKAQPRPAGQVPSTLPPPPQAPQPPSPNQTPQPSSQPSSQSYDQYDDFWRYEGGVLAPEQRVQAIKAMLRTIAQTPGGWFEAFKPGSHVRKWFEDRGFKMQTASDQTPRGRFETTQYGLDPMVGFSEFGWENSPNHGPEGGGGEGSEPYGANQYNRNFSYPEFTDTFEFEPWTRDFSFTAPGQQEIEADPVYQQRISAAQKAIERSAAARGTLLGKGTLMALQRESQGIASEEGDKIYGRRLGEAMTDYNMDRESYLDRQDQRLGEYGLKYAQYGDNFNRALQTEGFNYGVFGDDWNRSRQSSQDLFGNNYDLARLGLDADRLQLSAEQQYWDNYFNSMDPSASNESRSRAANAQAAGQAGSGSQWANGLNNTASLIGDYYSRRRYSSSYGGNV